MASKGGQTWGSVYIRLFLTYQNLANSKILSGTKQRRCPWMWLFQITTMGVSICLLCICKDVESMVHFINCDMVISAWTLTLSVWQNWAMREPWCVERTTDDSTLFVFNDTIERCLIFYECILSNMQIRWDGKISRYEREVHHLPESIWLLVSVRCVFPTKTVFKKFSRNFSNRYIRFAEVFGTVFISRSFLFEPFALVRLILRDNLIVMF